jgi:hypothetical protein
MTKTLAQKKITYFFKTEIKKKPRKTPTFTQVTLKVYLAYIKKKQEERQEDLFKLKTIPKVKYGHSRYSFYSYKKHYGNVIGYMRDNQIKQYANATKTKNSIIYRASNNFKEYEAICSSDTILPNGSKCHAGEILGTASIDSESALTAIHVEKSYRRNKIGTNLIRFIKKCCKQFTVYVGTENNSRYRLSEEGAKLIRFCEVQRILDYQQIIEASPISPSNSLTYT